MKKILLILSFALMALNGYSQEQQEHYIFKFAKGNDMFYTPYEGNDVTLREMESKIQQYTTLLKDGYLYISVASYATSGNGEQSAREVAFTQRNRVKSELISKGLVTEEMFATDEYIAEPYGADNLYGVVVVTIPTPIQKVREVLGDEKADRIEQYYQGIADAKTEAEKQRLAELQRAEAERLAKEQEAARLRAEEEERARLEAEEARRRAEEEADALAVTKEKALDNSLSLRTNIVRLATIAFDLGVEYKFNRSLSIVLHGTYANQSLDAYSGKYAQWQVSPELRYYFTEGKRLYAGIQYQVGEIDFKNFLVPSYQEFGYQSNDLYSTIGIVAGYCLPLSNTLSLDLGIGVGSTSLPADKYSVINDTRVLVESNTYSYFGVTQASVTLNWRLF